MLSWLMALPRATKRLVTLSADPSKVTANLRGPICINTEKMHAKQMILVDESYHTKHSILEASSQEA